MKLAETQALFSDLISGAPRADAAAMACLVAAPGPSLQRRIDIYLETVRLKTVQRMRASFARVAQLVGEETFARLVELHVRACPPTARTPQELLVRWPGFLTAHPEAAGRPDIGDVARIELARAEVATDAAGDTVSVEALARIEPARCAMAVLRLIPALRLLATAYEVSPLWQSLEDGAAAPPPLPRASRVLVWRRGLTVFHTSVEPEEAAAIERAQAGAALEKVCEAFAQRGDAVDAAHAALFAWFARGLVEAVEP